MHVDITEKGSLGIMYLKRFWHLAMLRRQGQKVETENPDLRHSLLNTLRLGLGPATKYLYSNAPDFEAFENWIRENTGHFIDPAEIERFNRSVLAIGNEETYIPPTEYLLTDEEKASWNENGYLIIRDAVSKEDCRNTLDVIFSFLGIDENDPSTWYNSHADKSGIMVELFNHQVLEKNRRSPKIKSVCEQLWQRNNLYVSADRVSFNPPETQHYPFQGPDLHWDVSLKMPIPFGLQGLLYLSDTAENQGAFTLVPGFQNFGESWLSSFKPGDDPRTQNLHALGSKPIAANAGDFIVWHQALPHGSSPNTAKVPRIVQYINYQPLVNEVREWV